MKPSLAPHKSSWLSWLKDTLKMQNWKKIALLILFIKEKEIEMFTCLPSGLMGRLTCRSSLSKMFTYHNHNHNLCPRCSPAIWKFYHNHDLNLNVPQPGEGCRTMMNKPDDLRPDSRPRLKHSNQHPDNDKISFDIFLWWNMMKK